MIEKYTVMRLKEGLEDDKCYIPGGIYISNSAQNNGFAWVEREGRFGIKKIVWTSPGHPISDAGKDAIRYLGPSVAIGVSKYLYVANGWKEMCGFGLESYFEVDMVHFQKTERAKSTIRIGDLIEPNDRVSFLTTMNQISPSTCTLAWLLVIEKCGIGAWCLTSLRDTETCILVPWNYLSEFTQ